MWIRNTQTDEMINISDCKKIVKQNWHYDSSNNRFGIYFGYIKDSTSLDFKEDEKGRDNFYQHIISIAKPLDVDPNKKPIKL